MVFSLSESRSATSLLRRPAATWRTISSSRGVSLRRDEVSLTNAPWIDGGIHTSPAATAVIAEIKVSKAKRLWTTARAPILSAVMPLSTPSFAVRTMTEV